MPDATAQSAVHTKVTSQFRLLRADEKTIHDQLLRQIAEAGETNRFGCLYLIDADGSTKVGITTQDRIADRLSELQTGNHRALRVVSLCFFYSRDVALEVEHRLKQRHRHRRLAGGTEWFQLDREALCSDIVTIAHELAAHQFRALGKNIDFVRPTTKRYFYGLLVFDIQGGELRQKFNASPETTLSPADENFESREEAEKRNFFITVLSRFGWK